MIQKCHFFTLKSIFLPGVLAGFFAFTGCGNGGHEHLKGHPLLGQWTSVRPDIGTDYVFSNEGECLWIFNGMEGRDTFTLDYSVVDTIDPKILELRGFDRGPLEGMVMFGIYEISGDSMKLDFEPGDAMNPVRLKMFREGDLVVFHRAKTAQ